VHGVAQHVPRVAPTSDLGEGATLLRGIAVVNYEYVVGRALGPQSSANGLAAVFGASA
jgi:hypothetical protein